MGEKGVALGHETLARVARAAEERHGRRSVSSPYRPALQSSESEGGEQVPGPAASRLGGLLLRNKVFAAVLQLFLDELEGLGVLGVLQLLQSVVQRE